MNTHTHTRIHTDTHIQTLTHTLTHTEEFLKSLYWSVSSAKTGQRCVGVGVQFTRLVKHSRVENFATAHARELLIIPLDVQHVQHQFGTSA